MGVSLVTRVLHFTFQEICQLCGKSLWHNKNQFLKSFSWIWTLEVLAVYNWFHVITKLFLRMTFSTKCRIELSVFYNNPFTIFLLDKLSTHSFNVVKTSSLFLTLVRRLSSGIVNRVRRRVLEISTTTYIILRRAPRGFVYIIMIQQLQCFL